MDGDFWAIVDSPTKFKAVFHEKPQAFVKASFTKGEAVKMSGRITFFAAALIVRRDDAMIMTDSAVECRDAEPAIRVAEQMSKQPGHIGSWAYSRSGDPTTGRYDPVEVLKRFGGVLAPMPVMVPTPPSPAIASIWVARPVVLAVGVRVELRAIAGVGNNGRCSRYGRSG